MHKIILNMGAGTLSTGYPAILGESLHQTSPHRSIAQRDTAQLSTAQLSTAQLNTAQLNTTQHSISRFSGKLPPAPALSEAQQVWQSLYTARIQNLSLRIHLVQREGTRYSESTFQQSCSRLKVQLNKWLSAPEFLPIDRAIRSELAHGEDAQIILETTDPQIRKLPWHLWDIFQDYPQAELTLSTANWRSHPVPSTRSEQARILAVFGGHSELDLSTDLNSLNQLPNADVSVLESPTLTQLHEQLWQPQGWDIFFFAGHSRTQDETGIIDLSETERLTVEQIRYALTKAIQNGLKIAIFNSCDGLGLAQQLGDLQIPYVVVMREPIPDAIAQQFLRFLLTAFASGKPFHLAVGEARQRLAGLDTEVPCASWLPIVWQNPTAPAIYWRDLQSQTNEQFKDTKTDTSPATAPPLRQLAKNAAQNNKPSARVSVKRFSRNLFSQTAFSQTVFSQTAFSKAALAKSLLVGGIVIGLRALRLLEPIELAAYDHLMRSRPVEPVDSRIVVIEATEQTTSEYGYPLPDSVLTQVISRIDQHAPLAIGLDLHRGKPRSPQQATSVSWPQAALPPSPAHSQFLQQVQQTPNLFLVCAYSSTDQNYQIPPQLSQDAQFEQVGFSDLPIDTALGDRGSDFSRGDLSVRGNLSLADATVRRQILSYDPDAATSPSSCTTPYSLSFQLAFEYLYQNDITPLEVTPDEHWKFGSVIFRSPPSRFGGYQELANSSQILLNYRTGQPAQKLSVEQLLSGRYDPEILRDRVVLIGYNAPVSNDHFKTPYGAMSGVWIHTHMTSQLISAVLDDRPLIRTLPYWRSWQWADMLWILTWSVLSGWTSSVILAQTRHPASAGKISLWLLTTVTGALLLYGLCWLAILEGLWLPLVPTGIAALGAATAANVSLNRHSSKSS